jgi:ankyrin repeat protein
MNHKKKLFLISILLFSHCLSIKSIPDWHREEACVIYSGVRCCNCTRGGGHPAAGVAVAVAILRMISLPFDFIIDSFLLPISVPFQVGKSIYYWNYNRKKIKQYDSQFPLHVAIVENKINDLKKLVSNQVNLEAHDSFGVTPLLLAIWKNDKDAIEILLQSGADPNNPSKQQIYIPEKWVKSIEKRMNVKNGNGYYTSPHLGANFSPLLWATKYSSTDILKLLLKKGANLDYSYKVFDTIAHYDLHSVVNEMVEFYLNEGLKPEFYQMYKLYKRGGVSVLDLILNSKSKSIDTQYSLKEELKSLKKFAKEKEDLELLLYLKTKGI